MSFFVVFMSVPSGGFRKGTSCFENRLRNVYYVNFLSLQTNCLKNAHLSMKRDECTKDNQLFAARSVIRLANQ